MTAGPARSAIAAHDRPLVLWLAGVGWDEVRGTDRRLVEELSGRVTVLWCDPPVGAWRVPPSAVLPPFDQPRPGILRVRVPTLPWSTRPVVRRASSAQARAAVRRALRVLGTVPGTQVVASPIQRFIPGVGGTKVYYQTDDWLEGASLMGLSRPWISRNIKANSWEADAVAAVTDLLLNEVMAAHAPVRPDTRRRVLANGCYEMGPATDSRIREPVAGLVGQVNERLDLAMLEALAAGGVPVRIIGPRTDTDRAFGRRLDSLLSAPGVDYRGAVPAEAIPGVLAGFGVGLTPYAPTPFNRASFPLKSLEYLSAGLAVVSTDLPSVRWLGTGLIGIARTPGEFVTEVRRAIRGRASPEAEAERRAFAAQHTWNRRAAEFLELAGVVARD